MPGGTRREKVNSTNEESTDQRIRNGKGLRYRKDVNLSFSAINNGYLLTYERDQYVFSEVNEMMEFVKELMPMKGTEYNFIRSLDEDGEYDNDEEESW